MKVYVTELLLEAEYDGQVNYEIFDNLDKAKQCMEDWKELYKHLIEDTRRDIDQGILYSQIIEKELYFYACNSFNFVSLTINIKEKEIR